jgi:hypothetical protein
MRQSSVKDPTAAPLKSVAILLFNDLITDDGHETKCKVATIFLQELKRASSVSLSRAASALASLSPPPVSSTSSAQNLYLPRSNQTALLSASSLKDLKPEDFEEIADF